MATCNDPSVTEVGIRSMNFDVAVAQRQNKPCAGGGGQIWIGADKFRGVK